MARLQWQFECQMGVNEGKWLNGSKDNIEYLKGEGFETRQIWVAVTDNAKEEEAKDGWMSIEKVDELLELQKEDIKAWLHRRARDFGGISYNQIDEFIDDYKILNYHKK